MLLLTYVLMLELKSSINYIGDYMDISTINIIVIGIITIGIISIFMNQIELASVALGAIAGYLSRQISETEISEKIEIDDDIDG